MKILQITNYPTVNPLHGGQIRASQLLAALATAGHTVENFSVYIGAHYAEAQANDLALDLNSDYFTEELAFISDYLTGVYLKESEKFSALAKARIQEFAPDIVIVEHPWLFDFVKSACGREVRIVYSSHNIEWRLKRDGAPNQRAARYIDGIRSAEIAAASSADLVIACTEKDAQELRALIAGQCAHDKVVVCGNGVEPFSCSAAEVSRWRTYFADAIGQPYPIFVSSGHMPNAAGFWSMLAPGLTFLRPGEEIVVVGGVCSLLTKISGIEEYRELNLGRMHLVGTRPKRELQAMVRASHVVLLPIASGEGSNLKTAEALESGCPIVGTSKAFRGFEDAMDQAHITIADKPAEFRRAVRSVLDGRRKTHLTPLPIRSRYYWSTQLQPLVQAVSEL